MCHKEFNKYFHTWNVWDKEWQWILFSMGRKYVIRIEEWMFMSSDVVLKQELQSGKC